jgi:adenylate cyclase
MYGLTGQNTVEARAFRLMTKRFPWPREIYALITERLLQAGAKVVVFDLTFPTSTEGDEPFRIALEKDRDRVIIGSNFVNPSRDGRDMASASHTLPADSLIPQASPLDDRVAFTNFWPDADEVLRRIAYRVTFEQVQGDNPAPESERFLALSARALVKAGYPGAVPEGLAPRAIRFTAPPRQGFPPHSVFEIFVPDYWTHNYRGGSFFRDKIVIVGAEGNWQHDEHQTPFGSMPGPEIHLNAINAALHGEFIREMPGSTVTLLTVLAGILAVAASMVLRSPWLRLLVLLVADAGAGWVALFVFNHASVYVPLVSPLAELNVAILLGFVADFTAERLDKNRLRRTLERYVSRDLVRAMLDKPNRYEQSLGGLIRPVTILFSDLRGYSMMSARTDPHVLVNQLNEYLTAMVECVFRFGGTLDKFIGDAVMAVWGNIKSEGVAEDANRAVQAALAMQVELTALNEKWLARGLPQLRAGIAIHHGEVVVGNIGSPLRMEFTVIGDAVNVSWKLEELTKELGCDFIVSEQVHALTAAHVPLRSLGFADFKGVREPIELFTAAHGPDAGLVADESAVSSFARRADVVNR